MTKRKPKSTKRISLDVNDVQAEEIKRIKQLANIHSTSDVFRHALPLLSVYLDLVSRGLELRAVNPKQPLFDQTLIIMPIQVIKAQPVES